MSNLAFSNSEFRFDSGFDIGSSASDSDYSYLDAADATQPQLTVHHILSITIEELIKAQQMQRQGDFAGAAELVNGLLSGAKDLLESAGGEA